MRRHSCLGGLIVYVAINILFFSGAFCQTADETPIRFAVIGDRTGGHVAGIYEEIIKEVERLRPDFCITVGDHIEGYSTDTAVLESEWREYLEIVKPLTMPLYLTPGNHDITYDTALATYEKYAGKPYRSFDAEGLHFVILDNSRWETVQTLPGEQIDWLISDLSRNKGAKGTFVFYHKPFWYSGVARQLPDTLHNIFKKFGVTAVFSGHFHIYYSGRYDGILYTDVGSSGGETDPGPTGLQYHFVWVTVDKNGVEVAPIKLGSVLPENEVTADEMLTTERIDRDALTFSSPLIVKDNLDFRSGEVKLVIRNIVPQTEIQDTIRWEVPSGWTIIPAAAPISIKAGDSLLAQFAVEKSGPLYPTPTVSMRLPYAEGKYTTFKKWIPISRETPCPVSAEAPVIDGKLDEPCWKGPVATLYDSEGGPSKCDSTRFFFAGDKDYLYLAAVCGEKAMDSLRSTVAERDGPVYREDCVGYFFQPDITKPEVYQIYFNPIGTPFDQKITPQSDGTMVGDRSWNGTYDVKTIKGDGYWSIEIRVPLSQFGTAGKSGEEWGLNFRRKQFRVGASADWQIPIDYDPKSLGRLIWQ
ncbi:hypothetical protein TRIP_C20633 [Candidatus Zixiibacteriota bacterium]|nr:hypothetical protein TRIP_C20633 [candidate division Zixibacteria bacterium]